MELKEKFRRGKPSKYVMYAQVRCDALSTHASKLEAMFKRAGVNFIRLLEPDPETLAFYADRLHSGGVVEVIELTDGMSRMFYLGSPSAPIRLEENLKPEFTLFFNVKGREGLEALLRVIGQRKIRGKRYRYRSGVSFAVSFLGGLLFSSIFHDDYWLQYALLMVITFLIYAILDYPFSLLRLKGVEVLSHDPFEKKSVKVFKIVRKENRRKG